MHSIQTYNGAYAGSSSIVLRLPTVRPRHRATLSSLPDPEASSLRTKKYEARIQQTSQSLATRGPCSLPVSVTPDSRPAAPTDGLNKEQLKAVVTSSLTVRVKAGPGSGKTQVVVARAHHLITERREDPANILAITFTNKAANELKERLEVAAGGGPAAAAAVPAGCARDGVRTGVLSKTFHGLGVYLLRSTLSSTSTKYGVDNGFKVMNQNRSEDLIYQAVMGVLKAEVAGALNKLDGPVQSETCLNEDLTYQAVKQVLEAHNATALDKLKQDDDVEDGLKNLAIHHAKLMSGCIGYVKRWMADVGHHDETTAIAAVVKDPKLLDHHAAKGVLQRVGGRQAQDYFCAYQAWLRKNNALDFDDLICLCVRTFDENESLRREWQTRFKHILVDEFQDIDSAQYRLVKLLRGESCGLFVVGDPDQAIYGWRGAAARIMGEGLEQDFPDIQTHILQINYRSVPAIVHAADASLTAHGRPVLYNRPVAARKPELGHNAPIICRRYDEPKEEAKAIANLIRGWVSPGVEPGHLKLSDIAVLYRNNVLSRPLEEAFVRAGIPYLVLGGTPFWDYKEIQDMVAYLHVLVEPHRSDVFLQRIINEPKRGLGDKRIKDLRKAADAAGLTLGGLLFEDCCAVRSGSQGGDIPAPGDLAAFAPVIADDHPLGAIKLTKPSLRGVQELRGLVAYLRAQAAADKTVAELVRLVLELSGYLRALHQQEDEGEGKKKSSQSKKDERQVAQEKLKRLEELHNVAAFLDNWYSPDEDEERSGGRGLAGLAAFLEHAALVTNPQETAGGELNAVRLMTLHGSKGLQFERVFIVGLEDDILPSGHNDGNLDEERRLFYVGLTRSKTRLHLSHCRTRTLYGKTKEQQISPFLNELHPCITDTLQASGIANNGFKQSRGRGDKARTKALG